MSEAQLEESDGQMEGFEAQLEGSEAQLKGSKAQLRGDGRTDKRTDGRKISPFYRTLSSTGAAAQKPEQLSSSISLKVVCIKSCIIFFSPPLVLTKLF